MNKSRYFGDKAFYKMTLTILIPIMIQMGITNFVSMLDNIMIGRIGTEQMAGVSIVNQLIFVFNLCIFGILSGAGIFTAQYFGQQDPERVRQTVRFKFWSALAVVICFILIFLLGGEKLIGLYLTGSADGSDRMLVMTSALDYIHVLMIGMPAFAVSQVYSTTMKESGETVVPMKAGLAAVGVNLVFNYLLIYGKCGFPKLGIVGAAIATVMARYVEMFYTVITSHRHPDRYTFVPGLYRTLKVPVWMVKKLIITGLPLLVNETLWALGIAILAQCYSIRGLNVVAGQNIASTINNVISVIYFSEGDAIAIIIGQMLGAGNIEEAIDTDRKLIVFSIFGAIAEMLIVLLIAPLFPMIYNTTDQAKELAAWFIRVQGFLLPAVTFVNASYFTLRSGGKTFITFLFDSGVIWVLYIPIAFILTRFTDMNIIYIFAIVQCMELPKGLLGFILLKKKVWVQTLVNTDTLHDF